MGWSQGSDLLGHIISARVEYLPETTDSKNIDFYWELIKKFEDCDADDLEELKGMDENMDKALMISRAEHLLHSQEGDWIMELFDFKYDLELTDADIQFLKDYGLIDYDNDNVWIND